MKRKPAVKLVGFLFDERLTWSGMIDAMAKKARMRMGMLTRLRHLLDDRNMYVCMFIKAVTQRLNLLKLINIRLSRCERDTLSSAPWPFRGVSHHQVHGGRTVLGAGALSP